MTFIRTFASKFPAREALTAVALSLMVLATSACHAQATSFVQGTEPADTGGRGLGTPLYWPAHEAAALGNPPDPADTSTNAPDDQWHLGFLPYLWFAGVHGYSGVFGHNAGVHASAGDLLSHADVGLMGTVEASKERVVIPVDLMWIALSDYKATPENASGVESISFRAGQFILTPKVGYKLIDTPKLKVDSVVGLRYWHLGERFHFNPVVYNGFTVSQNWVDGVAGARFEFPLSPKASVMFGGDAGGGQAAPDYQVWGLLGYKVKKNLRLDAGYRYLSVNYRNNKNLFLYDMITSGAFIGATFYLK